MEENRIKCPYCSELIPADSKKCRFCREWLIEKPSSPTDNSINHQDEGSFKDHKEAVQTVTKQLETGVSENIPHQVKSNKTETDPPQKRRTAWLRTILAIIYIGLIVGLVIYERNAYLILSRGQNLEKNNKYQTAYVAYQIVVEKFPLSFSTIEAKEGFFRIEPALLASELPERLGTTFLEEQFGSQYSPYTIDWLPFISWPLCSLMTLIVFITRIRRPILAFLSFIIMAIAVVGSVTQLTWYGFISFEPITEVLQEAQPVQNVVANPVVTFIASYALFFVTAWMTLTAKRRISMLEKTDSRKVSSNG